MARKNVNYNKMFEENEVVETIEEVVEEVTEITETIEEPEPVTELGKIVKCDRLRVRKEPNANAPVIKELAKGTEVMIDIEKSTEEFYSVATESGIEGFCMKKFVELQ